MLASSLGPGVWDSDGATSDGVLMNDDLKKLVADIGASASASASSSSSGGAVKVKKNPMCAPIAWDEPDTAIIKDAAGVAISNESRHE